MQQAKYPNLDNCQYSQQQVQQEQGLQEQLIEQTDQNIKFLPVLVPPQQNQQPQYQQPQYQQPQYQQFQLYQQNQVIPYAAYYNQNVIPIPTQNSNLIKDQDYQKQKVFLCGILGIYILWSILFVLLLFPLSFFFLNDFVEGGKQPWPFILLILFSITTMVLAKLGIKKNMRNNGTSLLLITGLISSYTSFYIGFFSTLSYNEKEQFGLGFFIGILALTAIIGNFIFNFILLVCLMFSESKLKLAQPVLIEVVIILIFVVMTHPIFLLSAFFMLPYSISLMYVFNQIIKGRFELEKNEVFAGAIAAFYGQIVCCTD